MTVDYTYLTIVAGIVGGFSSFVIELLKWLLQYRQARSQDAITEASAVSANAAATESLMKSLDLISETGQAMLKEMRSALQEAERGRILAEEKLSKLTRDYIDLSERFEAFRRECAQDKLTLQSMKTKLENLEQRRIDE